MCVPARLCVLRRTQRRTLLTWRACLTPPSPTLSPRSQARTLTTKAQERIARNLNAFEEETGYRILVLRCALVRTVRGVFETRRDTGNLGLSIFETPKTPKNRGPSASTAPKMKLQKCVGSEA